MIFIFVVCKLVLQIYYKSLHYSAYFHFLRNPVPKKMYKIGFNAEFEKPRSDPISVSMEQTSC